MSTWEIFYASAYKLYRVKKYNLALKAIQQGLKRSSDEGRLRQLQGLIYYKQGDVDAAIYAFESASLLIPLSASASTVLAECYLAINKPDLAYVIADFLKENETLKPEERLLLAEICDRTGHCNEALQICRNLVQDEQDHPQAFYNLSYYLGRTGHPLNLIEATARKAISLDPDNVNYRVGLASLLIRTNNTNRAYSLIRHFDRNDFQQVSCHCCLLRMVELFEDFEDHERAALARQFYELLTLDESV